MDDPRTGRVHSTGRSGSDHERSAIPLDENEGIYVRNIKSGKVRAIVGETYMLTHEEELHEKEIPQAVENLLALERDPLADRNERGKESAAKKSRDKAKVITFRVPHNAAVQIYDYKEKKSSVCFHLFAHLIFKSLISLIYFNFN